MLRTLFLLALGLAVGAAPAQADEAFQRWLQALWPEAQQLGVSRGTFARATQGIEPDLSLPDLVIPGRPQAQPPGQAEFVQTPATYLQETSFDRLAAQGRKLLGRYGATLSAIHRRFGVPPEMLLAIWARETAYGTHKLRYNAVRVLATEAYLGRRKDQFRREFLQALKMLEDGAVRLEDMRSSWAGAMGQTQFMPSDYVRYAVDFDGDGRKDIWNSVPDALASAAAQLAGRGWRPGERWAYEVQVPPGTDCTLADPDHLLPVGEWLRHGFKPAAGREVAAVDREQPASLLMPAGSFGPSFLILRNYYVIKEYNFSDLYVLFVGHLADRIAGARPFETPWAPLRQLRSTDLERLQRELAARGFYRDKIDGKAGMRTRLAVGAFEKANGLPLDCWPSGPVLRRMQQK